MIIRNLLQQAKRLIDQDSIRVVSFDLFDTLVCRPALFPEDILRLVWRSDGKGDIAIWNARLSAERSLCGSAFTIQKIWDHVAEQGCIEPEKAAFFAQREFLIEKKLISPREWGRKIFSYAVQAGKKVIVITDMYFSRVQLLDLLENCGYHGISRLYVSCEEGAVKRNGVLFDIVLAKEKIAPEQMLHIGDSRKADWIVPSAKKIQTLHFPKSSRLLRDKLEMRDLWTHFHEGTYESILYGFAVNHLVENIDSIESEDSLCIYAHLVVFPMLVHTALTMLTQTEVQKQGKYQALYFVSRDGYLIKQAYDILAPYFPQHLPSRYIQTSRIACRTLIESSYFDKLNAEEIPDKCTLGEFLVATVTDISLQQKILSALSPKEKFFHVRKDINYCERLLWPFSAELEEFHQYSRAAAHTYYTGEFADAFRVLLADCGFCGTIADYLTKGFCGEKKFDKFFLWENKRNKQRDRYYQTTTYTAFSEKKGCAVGPLVESIFSELTGSCLGFCYEKGEMVTPLWEQLWQPQSMLHDIGYLQKTAISLVKKFAALFRWDLRLLEIQPLQMVMNLIQFFQGNEAFTSALFSNVFFKEAYEANLREKCLADLIALRKLKGETNDSCSSFR